MSKKVSKRKLTDLEIYDHERGLKEVAVAESAEKYFARAKDLAKLIEAVTEKLSGQAEFAEWWDKQNKNKGGRPKKTPFHEERGFKAGKDGVPTSKVLHKWRKISEDFEAAIAAAVERCRQICESDKEKAARLASGNNEWYTPSEYVDLARQVLGEIDLDPATSDAAQDNIKAINYFTKGGLEKDWSGRVWLNPPYSRDLIKPFVQKMVDEYQAGRITSGIMLTHDCTDTEWWQKAVDAASAVCFPGKRISFIDTVGERDSPTQGQTFFYFGKDTNRFRKMFSGVGRVLPTKFPPDSQEQTPAQSKLEYA